MTASPVRLDLSTGPLVLPQNYRPALNLRETEVAIKFIKDTFERRLAETLNLTRVTAPLFVLSGTGVNDHLSGVEKPVRFSLKSTSGEAEIVQSLAKWKRLALALYGFREGEGLYADMNAIRPDEIVDHLHSIYVDQWDWERILGPHQRCIPYLKEIVRTIYGVIAQTEKDVCARYPSLAPAYLPDEIHFVHSEDLQALYPDLEPREREHAICRDKGAVFVIGIGATLKDGRSHDARAADYDDWSTETENGYRGLNGDILVWYPPLDGAVELSSMGIRVDPTSLRRQLAAKGEEFKTEFLFHRQLLAGGLPLTVGGGIGQSRLCMIFLRRAHVGEVQASIWPEEMIDACRAHGVFLL